MRKFVLENDTLEETVVLYVYEDKVTIRCLGKEYYFNEEWDTTVEKARDTYRSLLNEGYALLNN